MGWNDGQRFETGELLGFCGGWLSKLLILEYADDNSTLEYSSLHRITHNFD
jgi:hypothetical protein